jgi:putative ABC transport system permease protein
MHDTIASGLRIGGAGLVIYQAGVAADIFSSLDEISVREKLLADADVEKAAAGLSHVMPVGGQRFTVIIGVEPDGFTYSAEITDGPPIRAADEVSLGALAARNLQKGVGDTLRLGDRDFRIIGIFRTGVVVFDAAISVRLDVLQQMLGREGRVTAFFLKLREGADPDAVGRRIETANPDVVAISRASDYRKVDAGLEVAQAALWGVTLAAVIIGSVIVLNTMWMTVLERTREIGVLRAVGWSRRLVLTATLLESLWVGLAATVVGAALGVGLANLVLLFPAVGQFVTPVFTASQFGLATAAAVVLSLLGGALPAWRAARISPAEALRYE